MVKNSKQSDQGVHVPFVMSILRIADYIQIHSERAPTDLLNIKKLMSPISRGEWNKHHAIDQIHQNHDDPEAIFVDAEPTDAITYESLERLFSDIQKELDLSWSILGEVYGRYKNLNLGLNIRRIRSSLDNKKDFIKEKKIKYIPEVFRFRTAHTKLMELLIKPLYGNHPEIGIRELLQNSVDAIKERVDLEKKHSDFLKEDLKINLILVKERNDYYFVIKDNGVGMTKEIIRDYFLNIGASFRYSDIWKNQHINNGKTNFSRIGRFGVGVLAAYLLGEKIYVQTRNMFEDYGLSFSCESVHSPIQLERINMDVGTIIKIEIDELTYNYLFNKNSLWDWYLLSDVVIERSYNEDGEIGVFHKTFEVDVSQFHQLETKSSCEVKFSFMSFFDIYRNEKNILTCNGVNIKDSEYSNDFVINKNEDFIILKKPSLLVEDKEGIFPLDLQRQRVVENPDFTDDLRKTLYERIVINAKAGSFEEIKYIRGANCNNYIYGENRKYLFDLSILKVLKVKKLCYFITHEKDLDFSSLAYRKICKKDFLITSFNIESTKTVNVEFLRSVFLKDNSSYYNLFFGSISRFSNKIILIMKKTHIADYVSKGNYPPTYWERLFKVNIDENWTIICNKPISIDTIDIKLDFILPYLIEHKCRYFLSYDFNWDDVEIEVSDFAKVYQKTYPDFNLQ
ncbi:ATP-binding protein [Acinetobacter genomosp. 33YU]|uniref:HD domain-containing protein n=2 Tax=Acinetobacter TaxID=469 RepID=UPI0011155982|nr:ATP-binding protein [Acinetobacter genomosp. 33YU]